MIDAFSAAFDAFVALHGAPAFAAAMGVLFVAGFAKGLVGFALPLIAVSGMGAFLPAQTAVALMIVAALVSNVWQTLRDGWGPAAATTWRFRRLLVTLLPMIFLVSQLVPSMDERLFFLTLGFCVVLFTLSQLAGLRAGFMARAPAASEYGAGLVGGFFGGLAGIWGPPVTMYLIAIELPKAETMRALGMVFGLGSVALFAGHLVSGLLNAETLPLSVVGVLPVLSGMAVGFALNDRMDAKLFRRATLAVLLLTGLNLLRRGLTL
jgi:uncharacterized membrane protein YfcA